MIQYIKALGDNFYNTFNLNLYKWSFNLAAKKDYESVYKNIRAFIEYEFKEWFDLELSTITLRFLGDGFDETLKTEIKTDIADSGDVSIEIGTVHSVKGQTHCATMYVETSYHDYETMKLKRCKNKNTNECLPNPLFGDEPAYRKKTDSRAKQTMKMMYVGLSRPTHLLCLAVLHENVKDDISKFKKAGWEIDDSLIEQKSSI